MVDTPPNNGGDDDDDGGDGNDNANRNTNNNGNNTNPDSNPDNDARDLGSSLGPEDNDILNESLGNPNYDALRVRLVRTTSKITNEKRRIREEQEYLMNRWDELF